MFRSVFILIMVTISLFINAQAKPLKIVCHEFAPFSFNLDKRNTGILVEIAELACKNWQDGCEIELLPNRRAKQHFHHGLANGHFMGWNKERTDSIWFSIPLLRTEYGFYSQQSEIISNTTQLTEKNIAVFAPSNTYQSLLQIDLALKQQGLLPMNIIQLASANEQPIKMLSMGRFHAYFVNRDVGKFYADQLGITQLNYFSSSKTINYYLGFTIQYNEYETIKSFNHHLESLFQQGAFDAIYQRWNMQAPQLDPSAYPKLNIPY